MSTLVNTSSTEISVLKQKHDELLKKSLLTRSQFEGQLKEKTKVISDLKVKEGKDIDTMIDGVDWGVEGTGWIAERDVHRLNMDTKAAWNPKSMVPKIRKDDDINKY
ncbi:hypothetical protein Tco_0168532 [Tanacetum coccineum]|uniref:Uncharacterized protein n=1 Tax=Tanacetum coccineum TaxID=301880 RepID=A0ABQ5CP04_9ASTR